MEIISRKQLQERERTIVQSALVSNQILEAVEKPADRNIEYLYMHPDHDPTFKLNGSYIICGNEIEIVNGIIKTDDPAVSDKLRNQGFVFLYKRSKNND